MSCVFNTMEQSTTVTKSSHQNEIKKSSSFELINDPLKNVKHLTFTRYLFISNDVMCALATSILEKDIQKCLNWSCELLYSGLIIELINTIWTVYFQYFFTLNHEFFHYLVKQTKIIKNNYKKNTKTGICDNTILTECEVALASIFRNLYIRPRNNDVAKKWQLWNDHSFNELDTLLQGTLSNTQTEYTQVLIHESVIPQPPTIAQTNRKKIMSIAKNLHDFPFTDIHIHKHLKLLAITELITTFTKKIKLGKKLFVSDIQEKDIYTICKNMRTISRKDIPATAPGGPFERHDSYKILPNVVKLSPLDKIEKNIIGTDQCKNAVPIIDAYCYNWIYYASNSPLWKKRILAFNGKLNHDKKCVDFDNDDDLEEFHCEYGLEPDEQGVSIFEKNLALLHWDDQTKMLWTLKTHPYTLL